MELLDVEWFLGNIIENSIGSVVSNIFAFIASLCLMKSYAVIISVSLPKIYFYNLIIKLHPNFICFLIFR